MTVLFESPNRLFPRGEILFWWRWMCMKARLRWFPNCCQKFDSKCPYWGNRAMCLGYTCEKATASKLCIDCVMYARF